MQEKTVTVELPESAFRRLKRASELTYRPVNEILVSAIDAALIAPPNLPIELAEDLGALNLLSDEALWATAQPSFSPTEQYRLQQLNHSAGERSLTEAETTEQETLLNHTIAQCCDALNPSQSSLNAAIGLIHSSRQIVHESLYSD